ncbi:hypothetical protein [Sandaracinus amylolyticus]|uniref:hypothetical protein n=1 Tax=Sandaracinus amylolyticus TaxID=927083 RepID=UPI001F31FAD4|nr:hypothetical protein [Sandaracinus amylolyticus]UJR82250.1 Hypothetical protein I5071_43150 [Sandaracinus amylolyticus]
MVTTQDVSFGMLWAKLVGKGARWAPGDDDAPALHVLEPRAPERPPTFGAGLVAVWVAEEGPVLICEPNKGLRAIKAMTPGTPVEDLRRALRESGAVVREQDEPRRDTIV